MGHTNSISAGSVPISGCDSASQASNLTACRSDLSELNTNSMEGVDTGYGADADVMCGASSQDVPNCVNTLSEAQDGQNGVNVSDVIGNLKQALELLASLLMKILSAVKGQSTGDQALPTDDTTGCNSGGISNVTEGPVVPTTDNVNSPVSPEPTDTIPTEEATPISAGIPDPPDRGYGTGNTWRYADGHSDADMALIVGQSLGMDALQTCARALEEGSDGKLDVHLVDKVPADGCEYDVITNEPMEGGLAGYSMVGSGSDIHIDDTESRDSVNVILHEMMHAAGVEEDGNVNGGDSIMDYSYYDPALTDYDKGLLQKL